MVPRAKVHSCTSTKASEHSHTAGSPAGLVKKIIYYPTPSFSESQDLSGVEASDFHFGTIGSGAVGLGFLL